MKNEVNRALVAKKTKYIVLGLLMSMTLSVNARTFQKGEELYVNMQQSFDWTSYSAVLYLYLFDNNGHDTWIDLTQENGKMYKGALPSGGNYTTAIVVRKNPSNPAKQFDGDVWTQTANMDIPDDWNCIDKFDDAEHRWAMYSPQTSKINAYVSGLTSDEIHVCPSALGCTIALRPKLNADTTDYIYAQVTGQEWYMSTNGGSSWTSINGNAGVTRSENNVTQKDLFTILPNPLPTGGIYYYLHSSIPGGRHLIYIQDDAPDCALSCEITAFETAVSDVNADDNTYTLDGMVAFGKADGKLVIECDGKSVTIDAPVSPQTFSLHGVPAATEDGKTTTATAYFQGDQANCSKTITIKVPNAKEEVEVVKVDSLTGKGFVLTPKDYDPANTYIWLANGDTIKGAPQVLVIDAFGKDSTVTYTYKEYYPPSGSMEDLMENGSYEDAAWDYSTKKVSDYDFWGSFPQTATTQINFYTDTLPGGVNYPGKHKDNGFAVVRNANNFYPTYAKVGPKDGNNFALFDAKSGNEGANMKAWYATTANNSKLKLKKGTTYVLSFWAANINNYGEMDNAARFRFYIEDISGATPVKLDSSELLDLSINKYRNNLWHQCSKTYTAKADYNNIRISVVNLNNRSFNIGNDFALDDIQFHPISSVSKVVKTQQQFVVTAHEPKVDAFTATVVPLDCDAVPNYTVKMHVEYQNPKGQLVIKDMTTNTDYPYTVPAVAFDTKATLDKDTVINGLTPVTHTWEAYFDEWTTAKITGVTTDSPVVPTIDTAKIAFSEPGCTDVTTTLSFDLDYTYQQDTFTYWVDALPKKGMTYSKKDKTKQTLKNLQFSGIPADGKNNHVLHISFAGPNSCIKDYDLPAVPFSPVIDTVTITGTPTTVPCGTTAYDVNIAVTPHYATTSKNIILTYDSAGVTKTTAPIAITAFPYTLTLYNLKSGSSNTVYAAFSDTPDCTKDGTYTLPKMTSCIRDSVTRCESELPYYWPNDNYKPYSGVVGENKYGVGTDSLFLFVKEKPTISTIGTIAMTCDEANVVRIPFSVAKGHPDNFDIDIVGTHFPGTLDIVGTDTAFVFTPATMEAGDYAAHVTVGETDVPCTSTVDINFTIAISGQMYSKWTDVLFIGNKEGRYTGYQWFADGAAMGGETLQYLYDPKGLSGTAILYHCRLTTTDGKTLYTCPQTFDEVTPSRTVTTTPAQVKSATMYDTMGRVIKGTPHNGIYILSEELENGEIRTRKITIYE